MRAKEFITEAFDQPYPIQWEEGEDGGTADALATLGDGTYLSIMFTDDYYGDELGDWGIEFHRNNSQEVTGEGDAQKVFATVLEAIRQFVDSHNPNSVTFSASKEPEADMAQPGANVNPESRAKLYNRLVQRYAGSMGYSAQQEEGNGKITYVLRRATQDVAEGAVEDLEKDLDDPKSYSAIDHMMQTIARDHGITGRQLHDKFVDKHGVIPDKWTRDQLRELSFLGSECTKDCSGHRAGYDWSKRKGLRQANSWSPSFNKGAGLAVAGK